MSLDALKDLTTDCGASEAAVSDVLPHAAELISPRSALRARRSNRCSSPRSQLNHTIQAEMKLRGRKTKGARVPQPSPRRARRHWRPRSSSDPRAAGRVRFADGRSYIACSAPSSYRTVPRLQ